MKKEMNNKGFSLVELIIVIAIMAVLMGVLAPQLLTKVEDSRKQSDLSAMAEVENAVKIALAKESVYSKVTDGTTVTIASGSVAKSGSVTELDDELARIVPDVIKLTSNTWKSTGGTVEIGLNADGTFKLTCSWKNADGSIKDAP